jgi:hypothetical protein
MVSGLVDFSLRAFPRDGRILLASLFAPVRFDRVIDFEISLGNPN